MINKLSFNRAIAGFSLVEMAVVLIILGFVLGALLLPLQAQRNQLFQSQSENTLETVKKALLGYAQAQGRLPCPAISTSHGLEQPVGGGNCAVNVGFLPAATLGIQPTNTDGFATDGWNNPIRYAITAVNSAGGAVTPDFTTSNEMSNVGIASLNPNLIVCSDSTVANCSATNYLIKNAVAVIISTGPNFATSAGVDETSNLTATTTFYSRTPEVATIAPSKEFDDMVIWISPYVLYNAMIEAGQLH